MINSIVSLEHKRNGKGNRLAVCDKRRMIYMDFWHDSMRRPRALPPHKTGENFFLKNIKFSGNGPEGMQQMKKYLF